MPGPLAATVRGLLSSAKALHNRLNYGQDEHMGALMVGVCESVTGSRWTCRVLIVC